MLRHFFRPSSPRTWLAVGAAAAAACASCIGSGPTLADGEQGEKLCIDKLACHRTVPPPRIPVVLVSCGSFNPPTIMHLRMFDLATAALAKRGYDVWGCYMSPVADAYGKKGLAPVAHRVEMCQLAAAGTDNVMVDTWEAGQPGYTRTLQVLRHVKSSLLAHMKPGQEQQAAQDGNSSSSSSTDTIHAQGLAAAATAAAAAAETLATAKPPAAGPGSSGSSTTATTTTTDAHASTAASNPSSNSSSNATSSDKAATLAAAVSPQDVQVLLLCGADLLASINEPGVWKDPDVILQEHSIVCVARAGTDVEALLSEPNTVLHRHREHILVVEEPVQNLISSSMVRWLLGEGQPVRYLVPDAVLAYIRQHGLYSTYQEGDGVLHV